MRIVMTECDWTERDLKLFTSSFEGNVFTSQASGYLSACELFNGMIEKRPALILQCKSYSDVPKAVRFARDHSSGVSIKGGGHNLSGIALNHEGITIDISLLRRAGVIPNKNLVLAQGGCRLGDIDLATSRSGLAVPLGTVSDTGVGGLALGGGIGWLLPKYGLTCDNIEQIELVDHKGEIVHASMEANTELFWALCGGGGGNYGIVTNFTFRAWPILNVLAGSVIFDISEISLAMSALDSINQQGSSDLCAIVNLMHIPKYGDCVSLDICSINIKLDENELRSRLTSGARPLEYSIAQMPFIEFQRMFDAAAKRGLRRYAKSLFLNDLSSDFVSVIDSCFRGRPSQETSVFVEEFHGKFNQSRFINPAFTSRDARYNLHIQACWTLPSHDVENLSWLNNTVTQLKKFARNGGSYINYNSDLNESKSSVFTDDLISKLMKVKAQFDPQNFFLGTLSRK